MQYTFDLKKILQYWGTPFITILYRCFLNREPDPNGLKYYLSRLEAGIDRTIIIDQFLKSSETKKQFDQKALIKFRLQLKHIQSLQYTVQIPIVRNFSSALPRKERILMNRMYELQYHIQHPSIPSRSEFIVHRLHNIYAKSNIADSFSKTERTLFNNILKSL